jgi:hypothetical protein
MVFPLFVLLCPVQQYFIPAAFPVSGAEVEAKGVNACADCLNNLANAETMSFSMVTYPLGEIFFSLKDFFSRKQRIRLGKQFNFA